MVYKTYIERFNTIIKDSEANTSLNPISELVYGNGTYTRALLWFDHNKVKELVDKGIFPSIDKMKHTLHITNAGSLDFTQLHDCYRSSISSSRKIRAMSFTLIFFLIPKEWDEGRGFDYTKSFLNTDFYSRVQTDPDRLLSTEACNWYQRRNGYSWQFCGIYPNEFLSKEYDKFANGKESIVIARQHFEVGNENIDVDITDTFNKFLLGEYKNNGIGIAFTPMTEITDTEYENYVGLLTNKTNTWYEPYVETRYYDKISDDRSAFALNKDNRLYLYATIGDSLQSLDTNPIVTLKDTNDELVSDKDGRVLENIESKMFSKGVYYIDLNLSSKDYEQGNMLYDTWSDISYNGTSLDDVELYFTLQGAPSYFKIGNAIQDDPTFSVSVSGIQEKEQILRGDVRKIVIDALPKYTQSTAQLVNDMDIRIYVKDGNAEVDFISWDNVNKTSLENFYVVDTNIFLPQRYYVDIRIKYGMSSIIHHDVLKFDIVEDKTNKFA